jgi:hypothetical protein
MKKLKAVVEEGVAPYWVVTVTDMDTDEEFILTIEAGTEKDAAFKAMEQINEQ